MAAIKVLFGFHAVSVRIKTDAASVVEVYFDASRRDMRMRQFVARAKEAQVRLIEADGVPSDMSTLASSLKGLLEDEGLHPLPPGTVVDERFGTDESVVAAQIRDRNTRVVAEQRDP